MLKTTRSQDIFSDIRQHDHLKETTLEPNSKLDFVNAVSLSVCATLKKGHFNLIRFLLDLGADPDEQDSSGKTALSLCAFVQEENWGVGLARTFIEKGARIGLRDGLGLSAVHYACIYGRVKLMTVFLNAIDFDLNQGDRLRHTPLFYASRYGNIELIKLLVSCLKKFDLTVDKPNKYGVTPLMEAWKRGHFECGDILVSEGGADEEIQDNVQFKTAKEWRNTTERRIEKERAMSARVRSSFLRGKYNHLEKRLKRPATAMRALLESQRKRAGVLPMEPDNSKLIRRAKDHDTRNDPEYALNLTPVDCFVVDKYNQPSYTAFPYSGYGEPPGVTWRKEFKILYKEFGVQCSPSYRDPPKSASGNQTETDYDRPTSPSVSDSTSFSDKASVRSFGRHGRRGSLSLAAKMASLLETGKESKRGQKGDAEKHGRENAAAGKRKLPNLSSSVFTKDKLEPVTGSNESLISFKKSLDSKESFGSRFRDVSMDGGKSLRPASRTGFHASAKSRAEN